MRAILVVTAATAIWATIFTASVWADELIGRYGQSGWDSLGQFLLFQLYALGAAVVSLVVVVVCWRVVGWSGRAIGLLPTLVTLCITAWTLTAE